MWVKGEGRARSGPMSSEAEESLYAVLISLVVAAFGALLTHSTVCTEQAECVRHGTCYALTDDQHFCSFKTSVSPAGLRMLNHSAHQGGMVELNQGVCAPGMRQNVDAEGTLRCLRALSFPTALSEEIAYAGADDRPGAPDHERWCGRWIEAGSIAYGVERWAFFDERATEAAVDDLIVAKGSGRLAVSDVSKFRTACRTMVVSNSAGAAATLAYRELAPFLTATTLDKALETTGFLAGHYCDAPALLGIGTYADAFTARVMPGRPPTPGALTNALYAVGESPATRELAGEFAQAMDGFELATLDAVTEAHSRALVTGSHAGTYVDALAGPNFKTGYEELNAPLARFVKAYGASAAEGGGPERASAYLHGLAANCALAARAVVAEEEGGLFFGGKGHKGDAAAPPPHAAALGRLHTDEADRFAPAGAHTVANASTLALSSLRASSSVATATRSGARAVCLAAAKRVFPDAFDHLTFEALVTPRLYERLQTETEAIREAVAVTLSEELVGNVFANYADRTAAVAKARAARVRIAGAPRGTLGRRRARLRAADAARGGRRAHDAAQAGARGLPRPAGARRDAGRPVRAPAALLGRAAQRLPAAHGQRGLRRAAAGVARAALCRRAVRSAVAVRARRLCDRARVRARDRVHAAVERRVRRAAAGRLPDVDARGGDRRPDRDHGARALPLPDQREPVRRDVAALLRARWLG